MKITQRQLRRIIKEERRKVLAEQNVSQRLIEDLFNAMQAIENATDENNAINIIEGEVQGFLEKLKDDAYHAERSRLHKRDWR